MPGFPSFYCWIIFHYTSIFLSIHPLMDTYLVSMPWLVWLAQQGTWGCRYTSSRSCFQFLWIYPWKWDYWTSDRSIFSFLRKLHTVFYSGYLISSASSSVVHKGSLLSTPSPILVGPCLLDDSHSNMREMILLHDFDLHFPDK